MSFAAEVTTWIINDAKKNPKKARDAVLLKLFGAVIFDTPVDKGPLRSNWQTNIGSPDLSASSPIDPSGNGAIGRARNTVKRARMQDVIYFTNNLPYAQVVELGLYPGVGKPDSETGEPKTIATGGGIFSRQAPSGMMRKNIVGFTNKINAEARRVNR